MVGAFVKEGKKLSKSFCAMLPNLSGLTLDDTQKPSKSLERYTDDLSSIDAPPENRVANIVVTMRNPTTQDEVGQSDWNFAQIRAQLLSGATFWHVTKTEMSLIPFPESKLLAYAIRLPISAPAIPIRDEYIKVIADAAGGFNYTIIVPAGWTLARNANARGINHERILEWANNLITLHRADLPEDYRLNRIAIRISQSEVMDKLQLDRFAMFQGNVQEATNSVMDYIAQELYLTLYAASRDIGPKVFACRCFPMTYPRTYEDEDNGTRTTLTLTGTYWRVVYALEAGDSDLKTAITNVCNNSANYAFAGNFGDELFELLKRTAVAKMILTDIKAGNMIAFSEIEDPESTSPIQLYTTVKMIDFGPDFATLLPLRHNQENVLCIMFVNCIMFAFSIASSLSDAAKICFYPYMKRIYDFIKREQTKYDTTVRPRDGIPRTLCQLVQEAMYNPDPRIAEVTLFENNTSLTNIIMKMLASVNNYTLKDEAPPISDRERAEKPLFKTYPYKRDQGLLRQLVQNVLYDYEYIMYPRAESSDRYQRQEALPPMQDPVPRPRPQNARRNPGRQTRRKMDEEGAYQGLEEGPSS